MLSARLHLVRGDRGAMHESMEAAVRADPIGYGTRWYYIVILYLAGAFDRSIAEADRMLADAPGFADARRWRGKARCLAGDVVGGLDDLQRAAEAAPPHAWLLGELSIALSANGRGEDAAKIRDELIERSERGWIPRTAIVLAELAMNDWNGVFRWCERAFSNARLPLCDVYVRGDVRRTPAWPGGPHRRRRPLARACASRRHGAITGAAVESPGYPGFGPGRPPRASVSGLRAPPFVMASQPGVTLPNGRAAWGAYAVVMVILAASSIAPFVRFETGGPRIDAANVTDGALYVVTWVPFVLFLVWYARRGGALLRSPALAWVGHIGLIGLLPALHTLAFSLAQGIGRGGPAFLIGGLAFQVLTLLGTLQYLVVLAVLLAVASSEAAEHERVRAAELARDGARLETQLTLARVSALRAQLQPHFLFNTLNSIWVLTTADPPGARVMIRRLSDLLRAVVTDRDRPEVPLRREIELLNAYLAIQGVRFGERLRIRVDVDPAANDVLVPTFVLQPLVENAIEYAVAAREEGGSITVSAERTGDRLVLAVIDDGAGCERDLRPSVPAEDGRGVGHRNTRDRLREMYGPAHAFLVAPVATGGCEVRLELPVRT